MRDNLISLFVAAVVIVSVPSCAEGPVINSEPDSVKLLEGSNSTLEFEKAGGFIPVKFVSSGDWQIDCSASWLDISRRDGSRGTFTVKFIAAPNDDYSERQTTARLHCGSSELVFTAVQKAQQGNYKVVAHRGGYLENKCAENSISALKATIAQRCYAAECDVMWTADDNVIICHPDASYMVNGLDPSTHNVEELRAAGTLTDGTPLPLLSDFLEILTDPEQNPNGTKLWLDIKGKSGEYHEKVMRRAAEIAKEFDACSFCEYLVPKGYAAYIQIRSEMISKYGIDCAWNGQVGTPSLYGTNGWGQMPFSTYMQANEFWPPTTYTDAGVRVSIYSTPSSNNYEAFYSAVLPYYDILKALFVNHPQSLIERMKREGIVE